MSPSSFGCVVMAVLRCLSEILVVCYILLGPGRVVCMLSCLC